MDKTLIRSAVSMLLRTALPAVLGALGALLAVSFPEGYTAFCAGGL